MLPTRRALASRPRQTGNAPWQAASTPNKPPWTPQGLSPEKHTRKPVSPETLAGIPWAGRSTLAGIFNRVATSGPNDPKIWRQLIGRADYIAHSFTAKQAALVLSAMGSARQRSESFLRRLSIRFLPALLPDAELVDLCGILSGLSQLDVHCPETFALAAERAAASAPHMSARQISLVANAYTKIGYADAALFERLLQQVPRRMGECTGRDAAVLLNALAQLPALLPEELPTAVLQPHLDAIAVRLPDVLPTADLHSLTLILNAFAQLRYTQKDALDLLAVELLAVKGGLERLSARQLAMVLNATARLRLHEPRLLQALIACTRLRARTFDGQGLCMAANALAKLPSSGEEAFETLLAQVPRLLPKLNGRQLAMLCHAWARAQVRSDELFDLLALPLTQKAGELSAYEVALAVYGFSCFRRAPPELFGPLLGRFEQLLKADRTKVADSVLVLLANALSKVGWKDPSVVQALEDYATREPSLQGLQPQTVAVFGLGEGQQGPPGEAAQVISSPSP